MASVEPGDSFYLSLDQALGHPNAPTLTDFLADDLLQIASIIGERWDRLIPSRSDPYRRTLIATGTPCPPMPFRFACVLIW